MIPVEVVTKKKSTQKKSRRTEPCSRPPEGLAFWNRRPEGKMGGHTTQKKGGCPGPGRWSLSVLGCDLEAGGERQA